MNLLTLQLCKEDAEKMIKDPQSWLGMYRISEVTADRIRRQGNRTLEVINGYENTRKRKSKDAADRIGLRYH